MPVVPCPSCQCQLRVPREGCAFRCPRCHAVTPGTTPPDPPRDGMTPRGPGMPPNPKERVPQRPALDMVGIVAAAFCLLLFLIPPFLLRLYLRCPPVVLFACVLALALGGTVGTCVSRARGRHPVMGFALGMLLGPLLSLLLLLDPGDPTGRGLRRCPFCREWVRVGARLCKHCGSPQAG